MTDPLTTAIDAIEARKRDLLDTLQDNVVRRRSFYSTTEPTPRSLVEEATLLNGRIDGLNDALVILTNLRDAEEDRRVAARAVAISRVTGMAIPRDDRKRKP